LIVNSNLNYSQFFYTYLHGGLIHSRIKDERLRIKEGQGSRHKAGLAECRAHEEKQAPGISGTYFRTRVLILVPLALFLEPYFPIAYCQQII
jgi:hypothetical protein